MKALSILPWCLCVGLVVSAGGAAPVAPSDQPEVVPASFTALAPAARLGLTFHSAAKDSDSVVVAPPLPAPILPNDIAPGTVWLEPYYVTAARDKLTEEKLLTDKGRMALALKRHISPAYRTTFGPLSQLAAYSFNWPSILGGWHPSEAEAMTLYRQEQRLKMLDEMDDLIRLETIDRVRDAKVFQRIRFAAEVTSR